MDFIGFDEFFLCLGQLGLPEVTRKTADERRKTNYVEKIYKLQEAYKAKRFQEVINIANEILPEADAKNKAALYQFLYNSHKALGQQEEAQEVLVKAREMQQKWN